MSVNKPAAGCRFWVFELEMGVGFGARGDKAAAGCRFVEARFRFEEAGCRFVGDIAEAGCRFEEAGFGFVDGEGDGGTRLSGGGESN